jgi:hypothetical protein
VKIWFRKVKTLIELSVMRRDERFRKVKNLIELSVMLVQTKKSIKHDIVYKLLKLVLVLLVATATVERVFSSMNYVKKKLRNKMRDQYLNDCLVTFIECDFFLEVKFVILGLPLITESGPPPLRRSVVGCWRVGCLDLSSLYFVFLFFD